MKIQNSKLKKVTCFFAGVVFATTVNCLYGEQKWNPKEEADKVLERLIVVTDTCVKGAHDAEMVLVGNYAYIVASVNNERAGESPGWPDIYVSMSIVNLTTGEVEAFIPFASSEQLFENEQLLYGQCFVPRIIRKDEQTLRCWFASQNPKVRQALTYYIDFDLSSRTFYTTVHRMKMKTSDGIFDMQPSYFHADAVKYGFERKPRDYGLYLFDSFKKIDDRIYVAINNFSGRQNALAVLNDSMDTLEIVGHYNEPQELELSESSVNRLPDGTWMAICRTQKENSNYVFTTSADGKTWEPGVCMDFVPNGSNSKPTFDLFNGVYYLGWQESTRINNVSRSVFNIDVSSDGKTWQRKYRFETDNTFQYPSFHWNNGHIWLVVTQGRKERIMFGMLE